MNHLLLLPPSLWLLWEQRAEVRRLTKGQWLALAIIGGGGSVLATVAFTRAFMVSTNVSVPVLIQKTQPCFALLLARTLLGESLPRSFWLLALVAFVGAYLLSFGTMSPSAILSAMDLGAIGLAFLAAATWGSCTVIGRLVVKNLSFATVTALRFVLGSIAAACALYLSPEWQQSLNASSENFMLHWRPFAGMAYLSGFVPMLIYYRGLQTTKASVATLCELSFPLVAVALNWILLGASLSWSQLVGGGLVVLAVTTLAWRSQPAA